MNVQRYLAPLYGLLLTTAACTGVTVGSGAGSSGCFGGANANQREPGDGKGDVQLARGDIAVAPSGEFVIFKGQDELTVGWPASGTLEKLPVTLPTRLAFSKTRTVVYVASAADGIVVTDDEGTIVFFNPAAERILRCPASEAIGASAARFGTEEGVAARRLEKKLEGEREAKAT